MSVIVSTNGVHPGQDRQNRVVVHPAWAEDDPVRSGMSVEQLGEVVVEYHNRTRMAAGRCLASAITCGHALALVREKAADGSWLAIARGLGLSRTTAYSYLRVYRNREQLTADMTIEDAKAVVDPLSRPRATPQMKSEAVRMVIHDGFTQRAAAEALGVSPATINGWLRTSKQRRTIEARRRRRRYRAAAAEAELRRREHWVLAREAAGQPIAKAYGLLRQCAQQLDLAKASADDQFSRTALDHALAEVYKAEELIAQALGVQVTSNPRGTGARAR